MRLRLTFCLIITASALVAQRTVVITSLPANTPSEDLIYLAGSANAWNPGDPAWSFAEAEEIHVLNVPESAPNTFQGKITRGSWATVEGNAGGGFLPDRSFNFTESDTLYISVLSWEGSAPPAPDLPPNVVVLDEAFDMPELNRTRRIRLYLPSDYDAPGNETHYPVLYMHDGQNLFSAQESFAGEWEVDEAMLAFEADGYEGAIIVAIDNGGAQRINEYTPHSHPVYGGGQGAAYTEFIVNTLKPQVDSTYRTLPGREHSGIMGSSLGGLISFYAAMGHQEVFSKVGVFSPSFWFNDSIYTFAEAQGKQYDMQFFFLAGGQEGASLQPQVQQMVDLLEDAGFGEDEIQYDFVPNGQHSEWFWAQEFPDAFEWLYMGSSLSANGAAADLKFNVYPNPTSGTFDIIWPEAHGLQTAELIDLQGRKLRTFYESQARPDVGDLPAGMYLLRVPDGDSFVMYKLIKQ